MPRRAEIQPRQLEPDAVHGSVLVAQLVNRLMLDGKKSKAEHIVYTSLARAAEKVEAEPIEVFEKAISNITPSVEVRPERATSLAMRWLKDYARARAGKSMREKLADEIIDAANLRGGAIKKKDDVHRMAEANKAFAHYRW